MGNATAAAFEENLSALDNSIRACDHETGKEQYLALVALVSQPDKRQVLLILVVACLWSVQPSQDLRFHAS